MKTKVSDELKQHFRPEFLNRVDDIVVFHQLTEEDIIQIVDLMIAKVDERLKDRDMGIELSPDGQVAARQEGLRPGAGRPAAAPDHPARDRGRRSPRRSSSASCAPVTSWWWTSRARARRKTFTFRGEEKVTVADAPPIEAAGSGPGPNLSKD